MLKQVSSKACGKVGTGFMSLRKVNEPWGSQLNLSERTVLYGVSCLREERSDINLKKIARQLRASKYEMYKNKPVRNRF